MRVLKMPMTGWHKVTMIGHFSPLPRWINFDHVVAIAPDKEGGSRLFFVGEGEEEYCHIAAAFDDEHKPHPGVFPEKKRA